MDLLISPESRLLSRILFRPKELNELETKGFLPSTLSLPYARAFEEIVRFKRDHSDMPSAQHLLELSPDIKVLEKCPSKRATVYWEKIYRRKWRSEIAGVLATVDEMLPEDTPDEALPLEAITEKATEFFGDLASKYSIDSGRPALLSDLIDVLGKEYKAIERGDTIGVPIPFEFLAAELIAWKNGRIYVVAGRPKTGKSWFALICAKYAMERGLKVLFVSLEMTQEELAKRLVCLLGDISYNRVVKGKLSPVERSRYMLYLKELEAGKIGRMIKLVGPGQAKTPEAIYSISRVFDAKMVFVDAFYNMDAAGEKSYEQMRDLMKRYRRISIPSNIPWMLLTQFNRNVRGRGSAHLDNLAFGDAIGMDANGMVYLVRDSYLKKARQVDMLLGEAREADDLKAFRHNWNFVTMDYSAVGAVEYGEDNSNKVV